MVYDIHRHKQMIQNHVLPPGHGHVWPAVKVDFANNSSALVAAELMVRGYESKTTTSGPGENVFNTKPK